MLPGRTDEHPCVGDKNFSLEKKPRVDDLLCSCLEMAIRVFCC